MSEHAVRAAQAQDAAQRAYIQSAVGASPSTANEPARLVDVKNQGVISDAEFEQLKDSTRLIERVVTTNGA